MFAWVRESGATPEPGVVQVDIDLCDGQGHVCVEFRGVVYEREVLPVPAVVPALVPIAVGGPARLALPEPAAPTLAPRAMAKPRGVALA